jgi:hypothetical protein
MQIVIFLFLYGRCPLFSSSRTAPQELLPAAARTRNIQRRRRPNRRRATVPYLLGSPTPAGAAPRRTEVRRYRGRGLPYRGSSFYLLHPLARLAALEDDTEAQEVWRDAHCFVELALCSYCCLRLASAVGRGGGGDDLPGEDGIAETIARAGDEIEQGAHGGERTGYKPRNLEYAVKPRELMNAAVRDVENARRMFDLMPSRTCILWNSISAYYAHDVEFQEALT